MIPAGGEEALVAQEFVAGERPGDGAWPVEAPLRLMEHGHGRAGMVKQGIMPGADDRHTEAQAAHLVQDVQEQVVIVRVLLRDGLVHVSRAEVAWGQAHARSDLLAIVRVGLHQGLLAALAVVQRREYQAADVAGALHEHGMHLERVQPHGVVQAVPFDGADRDPGDGASLPCGDDLRRPQALVANLGILCHVASRWARGPSGPSTSL